MVQTCVGVLGLRELGSIVSFQLTNGTYHSQSKDQDEIGTFPGWSCDN